MVLFAVVTGWSLLALVLLSSMRRLCDTGSRLAGSVEGMGDGGLVRNAVYGDIFMLGSRMHEHTGLAGFGRGRCLTHDAPPGVVSEWRQALAGEPLQPNTDLEVAGEGSRDSAYNCVRSMQSSVLSDVIIKLATTWINSDHYSHYIRLAQTALAEQETKATSRPRASSSEHTSDQAPPQLPQHYQTLVYRVHVAAPLVQTAPVRSPTANETSGVLLETPVAA